MTGKKIFDAYKLPILLSITLFVVILAITVERSVFQIALIALGTIVGTFILDIDYFIYAYFFEPERDFSVQVRGYTKHKDYMGAWNYIYYHKAEIKDAVLNSALFQIALAGLLIVVAGTPASMFIKALTISAFVNSMYRMAEEHFENRTDSWFWAFKNKPTKNTFYLYICGLILVLVFGLSLL